MLLPEELPDIFLRSLNQLSCAWFISSDTEMSPERSQIATLAKQVCFSSFFGSLSLIGWARCSRAKKEIERKWHRFMYPCWYWYIEYASQIWRAHLLPHRRGNLSGQAWVSNLICYLVTQGWSFLFSLAWAFTYLHKHFTKTVLLRLGTQSSTHL